MAAEDDTSTEYYGYVNEDEIPLDGSSGRLVPKENLFSNADPDYVYISRASTKRSRYTTLRKQDSGEVYEVVTTNRDESSTAQMMQKVCHLNYRRVTMAFLVVAFVVGVVGLCVAVVSLAKSASGCDCPNMAGDLEVMRAAVGDLQASVRQLADACNVTLSL